MATILTTIALVAFFAAVSLLVKRATLSSVCPICLGVSLTWISLTALMLLGYISNDYFLTIAILMGGTAVGIVYQGEKKLQAMKSFVPKLLVLIAGFFLAYLFLINISWLTLAMAILILIPIGYLFFLRPPQVIVKNDDLEAIRALEDKMEDCC